MTTLEIIGRMHTALQVLVLRHPAYGGTLLCAAAAAKVFREDIKSGLATQADSERYKMLGREAFSIDIKQRRGKPATSKDG